MLDNLFKRKIIWITIPRTYSLPVIFYFICIQLPHPWLLVKHCAFFYVVGFYFFSQPFLLLIFLSQQRLSKWTPKRLGYKGPELPSLPLPPTWAGFLPGSGKGSRVGTEMAFACVPRDSSPKMSLLDLCLSFPKQSIAARSEVTFAFCKLSLTQASMPRAIEITQPVITPPWFRISYCKAGEEHRRELMGCRVPPALTSISPLQGSPGLPQPVCVPYTNL